MAAERFSYSLKLDPVNENTYFHLSNIAFLKGDAAKALYWLDNYEAGPTDLKNKEYLNTHKQNPKLQTMRLNIMRNAQK
ncbi:hypothetical protein AAIR98_001613 [Elusimicrobium simillimum]|uniref:hypothetical protein n=1 Tax=Elusimicrobium simillimum TaxID=3143438 RepID=UPI003C6F42AB